MQAALATHDERLRHAIEANHGHIVKTTGDGVHAVFGDASQAVASAVDAQRALLQEGWAPLPEPLRVRMGLHTGAAELRADDYYGPAVNRAARIMSAAHGGQILVSLATEEVLSEALPPGVQLVDLGEHRLRDLARPQRIFQVRASDLPADFPPIRSADAYPGNLPEQVTSFVGRTDDLQGVAAALDGVRLVTITGTGGVGKTRLAVQVAAEVLPHFPDGAWVCELAAAGDADSMAQVVQKTLGVQLRVGTTIEDSIVEFLRSKQLLLVLDNCEHLMRPVREFAETVLRACPDVRMLATSREALGIAGEQSWPLRSLDVPASQSLDAVARSEAAALLADRARSVQPGFSVDAGNAGAIADICERLDGIPLALELAAARVVAMSPADVASRLDERFRLLTGGRGASVERHQTLRAAVDWSHSLLEDTERTVFARLAVFAGTFDARAAEAVLTGDGLEAWDVLDALTGLVAKSMVATEAGPSGTMRYQLLETMRQYAQERLVETADIEEWRRRHAEHYAAVTEESVVGTRGRDELRWRDELDADLDNIRTAVAWGLAASEDDDAELALRIIAALSFETSFNRMIGVGEWATQALERAEHAPPARRSDIFGSASYRALLLGDHEEALRLAHLSIDAGVHADSWSPGMAYVTVAYCALALGRHDEVVPATTEGLERIRAAGCGEWQRLQLAWTHVSFKALLGDRAARAEAEQVLREARALGNPTGIGNALHSFGWALARESPDEALAAFEEASSGLTTANDNLVMSAFGMVAQLRARRGDRSGALEALRASVVSGHELGDRPQFVATIGWGVFVFSRFGQLEQAAVLAGALVDGPLAEISRFPGVAQSHEDPALTRVRSAIGTDAYRDAAARGAAMSFDDVVAYMIREIDALAEADGAA
jgi:predicted ATPase